MKIAVHITHEAVQKIGGIGSVISGFCTADNYKSFFDRTVLYGPLFSSANDVFSRLGRGGEVQYSNADHFDKNGYHEKLGPIAEKYGIEIVYGKRMLVNEFNINKRNDADIILIGINGMRKDRVDVFKYVLWEKFKLESDRFNDWDYEQYIRIAPPYLEILEALYGTGMNMWYHFSHEYMGITSVLSVINEVPREARGMHRTIFWAHEISPARMVVEHIPGHDTAFYNIVKLDRKSGKTFEQEFPEIEGSYRTHLVRKTTLFDTVFAVSDLVRDEYLYLNREADPAKVKVLYNGIPVNTISRGKKLESRKKLTGYIENLFNFKPDVLFTHVTRLVLSKGIWRDLQLLCELDSLFEQYRMKGAFILISTLIGTGRPPESVRHMEEEYGWPVLHRDGWPDLVGYENDIYRQFQVFNAKTKAIKAVFLNQFGFERRTCGQRVPENTDLFDLRVASDAELGYSIYEPFGIAQLETLGYGSVALLSSSCGCGYMLRKIFSGEPNAPFHLADFVTVVGKHASSWKDMTESERMAVEQDLFKRERETVFALLPKTDEERLANLERIGAKLSSFMWEAQIASLNFSTL